VKIPAARLDLRKNFFSVRVCEKWNNLPSDIKCSVNTKSFKRNYRRYTGDNPSVVIVKHFFRPKMHIISPPFLLPEWPVK
jgi:hypothetical protein